MRKHTISAARLLIPAAAMTVLVGLAACGDDRPPPQTITRTDTTRTTTTPGYVVPAPVTSVAPLPVTSGSTTTTQTTTVPAQQ